MSKRSWSALLMSLLFFFPAKAADPWTKGQILMEVAYEVALVCDWNQTSQFHKTWGLPPKVLSSRFDYDTSTIHYVIQPQDIVEVNPLLGRHPDQATINTWCILSAIGHPIVTHFTPTEWRGLWQGATLSMELFVVGHNEVKCKVHLRF